MNIIVGIHVFQSPSLRGSGRFKTHSDVAPPDPARFQSPSLRGSGRFADRLLAELESTADVSIPFIAGQWSLHIFVIGDGGFDIRFQSPSLRGSGRFRVQSQRSFT